MPSRGRPSVPGIVAGDRVSPTPRSRDPRSGDSSSIRDRTPGTTTESFRPTSPRGGSIADRSGTSATTAHHTRHFSDPSRFRHVDHHDVYRCYPRQYYRLNYCNGYRGLGWYFGPPNFTYYYENPGVYYYSSREYIPSTYLSLTYSPRSSLDYSVQEALYNLGYYDGPLDGDIGPASRLAIANFQADNGLEPTGIIDETLLSYLQIE